MTFMLDTANILDIQKYQEILPLEGVTTNPSIIKKEGKIDFFQHLRDIRSIIGTEKSLHVQVVSNVADKMVQEALKILENVDREVYIKVPVSIEGLKAIKVLKSEGFHITATAIYSEIQAYLAIEAGADFVAPYYNRMENLNIDASKIIEAISKYILVHHAETRILGASYKNILQVNKTLESGGHTVTVNPAILADALNTASINKAILDFSSDWEDVFGEGIRILDLE